MKTVRTRVKSALRRNSKAASVPTPAAAAVAAAVAESSASAPPNGQLPAAASSAPTLLTKTDGGGSPVPPVSLATPKELKDLSLPFDVAPVAPTTESPVLPGLKFTGDEPEQIYAPPHVVPAAGEEGGSKGATPKKRVKSVPRVSSDDISPSPSIASRIQTTLPVPPKKNDAEEAVHFVSPVDPNYLIDEHLGSEPRILDQPAPSEPAYVEYTPKEVPSSVPPLHEVLAHHAFLKRLEASNSSMDDRRPTSHHEPFSEEKPLLEPSILSAEVDDILDSVWPLTPPSFPALGWTEHVLPSSAYYYSHVATRTVTDIDLRDEKKLAAVRAYLKPARRGHADSASVDAASARTLVEEGVDLWLRDAGASGRGDASTSEWHLVPMRCWVLHATRAVTFEPPSERGVFRHEEDLSDEDRLDQENRYWQYMATHPAHATLPHSAYEEAIEVVTWCYTDRVLRTTQAPSAAPMFTQKECVELLELLRAIIGPTASASSSAARTRIVAQILLRYTEWRQSYILQIGDRRVGPSSRSGEKDGVEVAMPYRGTILHFVKGVLCLGIPYLLEGRGGAAEETWMTSDEEAQREGGVPRRDLDDVWLGNGSQLLVGAVLLSASITFLAVPGELSGISRTAGAIAALCASASMVAHVVALRARRGRHHRAALERRRLLAALPLVLLVYALAALVVGVVASALGTHSRGRWAVVGVLGALGVVLAGCLAAVPVVKA